MIGSSRPRPASCAARTEPGPIDHLLVAQEQRAQSHGLGAYAPCIDGATVPRLPIDAIRDGAAAGIPILPGGNRDGWNLFEVWFGEVTAIGEWRQRVGGVALRVDGDAACWDVRGAICSRNAATAR